MKIVVNLFVSAFILACGIGGYILFGQKPEVPTQQSSDSDRAAVVETAPVTAWDRPFELEVHGEAVTYRVVTVGTEVEGRIIHKSPAARGGTYVRKDELLFEIDPANYKLKVDQLEAQLKQVDEELQTIAVDLQNVESLTALAEEDLRLQKNQLTRMQKLQDRRTANDTEVEGAMKQELVARNSLQSLRNQHQALLQSSKTKQAGRVLVETQLKRAELDVQRCRILSPLEGRIVDDSVEEGDYIKFGEILVHISDGSRMEVKCQLRSEELAWIWLQQIVPETTSIDTDSAVKAVAAQIPDRIVDPINLPAVPCTVAFEFEGVETIWDGYVSRLEGTGLDRETRTFPCRVLVEEPQKKRVNNSVGGRAAISPPTLLSGMYVTVRFDIESPVPLLQIPMEAVRPGGQVWAVRDNKLDVVEVSVAQTMRDIALVRRDGSGLQEGDRVIISPLASVRDGMSVQEPQGAAE